MNNHGDKISGSFFSIFELPETRYKKDILEELGQAMTNTVVHGTSRLFSGYAYFGQFIDHDITRLKSGKEPPGERPKELDSLKQLRTPALDLESLYGKGFDDPDIPVDKTNGKMFLGKTVNKDGSSRKDILREDDLPRNLKTGKALIGDDRNDENLIIAQLHVQFLRLHNLFVDKLKTSNSSIHDVKDKKLSTIVKEVGCKSPRQLYCEARRQVILHYQYSVLYDFLHKIIDPHVWNYFFQEDLELMGEKKKRKDSHISMAIGKRFLLDSFCFEEPRMPIEFSAATFRFGHSMIRGEYRINDQVSLTIAGLFRMTGNGGFLGIRTLPETHVIDWRYFFDLAGSGNDRTRFRENFARRIDTDVQLLLGPINNSSNNVAVRNLLRGNELKLPNGRAVANHILSKLRKKQGEEEQRLYEYINDSLSKIDFEPSLPELKECAPEKRRRLYKCLKEIGNKPPLWYFVLCEAASIHKGERLGPFASLIIAETFCTLINQSEPSIYHSDWYLFDVIGKPRNVKRNTTNAITELLKYAKSYNG
ncbi:peroxidase family protein [Aliikangiella coralliicola]|uniref:Peroxidase n=1 Tax=Aliikangiella coralliicola TaxID=2592383 RepID=A0A545U0F3_9GAMM|nr:peroxidase family protein [Aliikangiella coralliicola]TQV82944.1 hypothetical protein FLL46_24550 [Aliikangiella coralliicola]